MPNRYLMKNTLKNYLSLNDLHLAIWVCESRLLELRQYLRFKILKKKSSLSTKSSSYTQSSQSMNPNLSISHSFSDTVELNFGVDQRVRWLLKCVDCVVWWLQATMIKIKKKNGIIMTTADSNEEEEKKTTSNTKREE